jgi:hypothetical protein
LLVKRVYCSPILGTLLLKGEPLAGIEVVREVTGPGLPNSRLQDRVLTNERGQFEFPQVAQRVLQMPFQTKRSPSILQTLNADVEGYAYCIWAFGKSDFELGTETGQPEIRLSYELSGASSGEFVSGHKKRNFREVDWIIEGELA